MVHWKHNYYSLRLVAADITKVVKKNLSGTCSNVIKERGEYMRIISIAEPDMDSNFKHQIYYNVSV